MLEPFQSLRRRVAQQVQHVKAKPLAKPAQHVQLILAQVISEHVLTQPVVAQLLFPPSHQLQLPHSRPLPLAPAPFLPHWQLAPQQRWKILLVAAARLAEQHRRMILLILLVAAAQVIPAAMHGLHVLLLVTTR
jgi:hypothetical protein